jgi:hypothetical protein
MTVNGRNEHEEGKVGRNQACSYDTYDAGYEPKNLHKGEPNTEGRIHKWILEVNFQYIKICPSCGFPL